MSLTQLLNDESTASSIIVKVSNSCMKSTFRTGFNHVLFRYYPTAKKVTMSYASDFVKQSSDDSQWKVVIASKGKKGSPGKPMPEIIESGTESEPTLSFSYIDDKGKECNIIMSPCDESAKAKGYRFCLSVSVASTQKKWAKAVKNWFERQNLYLQEPKPSVPTGTKLSKAQVDAKMEELLESSRREIEEEEKDDKSKTFVNPLDATLQEATRHTDKAQQKFDEQEELFNEHMKEHEKHMEEYDKGMDEFLDTPEEHIPEHMSVEDDQGNNKPESKGGKKKTKRKGKKRRRRTRKARI